MKTFTRILTAAIATAFLAAGCVNEDPAYNKDKEDPKPGTTGFLNVEDVTMRIVVDTDTDTQGSDATEDPTKSSVRTRAVPDTGDFIVEIFDKNNTSVYKASYREFCLIGEPMEMVVGTYTLEVRSEDTMPDFAWEHPVYGCRREFSILKAQTTDLDEVVCTLKNIKVTFAYSVDLADDLTPATTAVVSLGEVDATFVKGETRAAYFKPLDDENTLNFVLAGEFVSIEGQAPKPVQVSKDIENVKAGQWRKITLVITWSDKGNVKFDIKVDTFVQDDEIVIDATAWISENIYDEIDNSDPTFVWIDHSMSNTFQLRESMFDEGVCIEPFVFNAMAPNGIESLVVGISSTNSNLMGLLEGMGIPDLFDLCALSPSSPAYGTLQSLGFPVGSEIKGKISKNFDIAGLMPQLYEFDGTHTFSFIVADKSNEKSTTETLRLLVDKEAERTTPTIVWRGYDIDQQHVLTEDMLIDIDVTSPTGIKAFEVMIISETLTPLLPEIGLDPSFDLCNITDPDQLKLLSDPTDQDGLGFPVNEQVRDKTALPFSINYFVPILKNVAGEHKFQLTVTDNSGVSTTKTVSLIVL